MIFRAALKNDIPQIQIVRNAVKENRLSNPDLVTDADVENYITKRGKGWVCTIDDTIAGFAIADLEEDNIWALFIHPEHEKKGIGIKLHNLMLDWYFSQGKEYIWLGTSPDTRAEKFYRKAGWKENGMHGDKEIKFEMTAAEWNNLKSINE